MSVKIIGHRGARGLLPELSLPGFSKALDLGVDFIELDVGVTRDGIVVAHHDYTLNPDITRDATGDWISENPPKICDLNFEDLRRFDIGRIRPGSDYALQFPDQAPLDRITVPTLEEVVSLRNSHPNDATLCIEVKHSALDSDLTLEFDDFVYIIASEIIRLDIVSTAIVQSFNWRVIHAMKERIPDLEMWHLTAQLPSYNPVFANPEGVWTNGLKLSDFGGSVPRVVAAAGGTVWNSNCEILDSKSIDEAHELGLKVHTWTANSVEQFEYLCAAGIDGIATDYPNRLISFLQKQA